MDSRRLIALKLQEFRASMGLTQEGFESQYGISYRTVQEIESGENDPRLSTLIKLDKIGVPVGELFNRLDQARMFKGALSLAAKAVERLGSVSISHREAVLKVLFSEPASSGRVSK